MECCWHEGLTMFGSVLQVKKHGHELEPWTVSGSRCHVNVQVTWLVNHCGGRADSPFLWSSLWDSSWWWRPALWHHGWKDLRRLSLCAELCNKCGCWGREDVPLVTLLLTSCQKTTFVENSLPGWELQCVQIPALWRQRIRQTENIKLIGAYSHHGHLWIPEHKHAVYLVDSVNTRKQQTHTLKLIRHETKVQQFPWCLEQNFVPAFLLCLDFACCADDLLGGVNVSILSHVHHGRPAGGDDSSGPGACDRGRGVDSTLPVWSYKVLVVTVLFITIEDDWGTFRCVPILERSDKHTHHDPTWNKVWPGAKIDQPLPYLVGVCRDARDSL